MQPRCSRSFRFDVGSRNTLELALEMHATTRTRALAVIDSALRLGPWASGAWDERARRVGGALLTALREALAILPLEGAVEAACAKARRELPQASAVFHETWSRVTWVWVVRQVVQAAHGQSDPTLREEVLHTAFALASVTGSLDAMEGAVAKTGQAFEQMVEAARDAFQGAQHGLQQSPDERAFFLAYVQQYKHIASLLAVGGHSVDSLLRGAVTRTDRVLRREGVAAWIDAPLATRRSWVQQGTAEAAWSLAAQVLREQVKGEAARDIHLWLARTACQIVSRIDRVAVWVPTTDQLPSATSPCPPEPRPPMGASELTNTETKMDSSKLSSPVLKTLEADASEAAWRMAGSQFVKLAKEPIVALLSRHLGPDDESLRGRIAAFLDTELGAALLAGVLSAGLSAMPLPSNTVAPRLARELRVRAMATVGDAIADVLMGPLRQVAVMYLQGQPMMTSTDPAALPASHRVEALKVATSNTEHAATHTEGAARTA